MARDDFRLVLAGHQTTSATVMDKRYDQYLAIQLMTGGGPVRVEIGARGFDLAGAWLWAGFPGPRIRFRPARPGGSWDSRYLAMVGRLPERWLAEGLLPRAPRPLARPADCVAAFDEVVGLVGRGDRWSLRAAANLVERILLASGPGAPPARQDWLDQLESRAARDPAWDPDWSQVAAGLGMPLSTLRKRFRRATGAPPHRWLLERRIAAARALLTADARPLAAIADERRDRDVSFFCRQFRSLVGLTPGAYRAGARG